MRLKDVHAQATIDKNSRSENFAAKPAAPIATEKRTANLKIVCEGLALHKVLETKNMVTSNRLQKKGEDVLSRDLGAIAKHKQPQDANTNRNTEDQTPTILMRSAVRFSSPIR